jgi:Ca2+-transporting ATPase
VVGIIAGKELFLMIETSVALFVAAVPEGLPIVATLALARGMQRMAKRNALVRRLQAVQTLGSTNVIFTDKTGTLTENRMTVTEYLFDGFEVEVTGQALDRDGEFLIEEEAVGPRDETVLTRALRVGGLCNNASVDEQNNGVGDPMEVALLVASRKAGMDEELRGTTWEEMREVAFDPEVKMMATFHKDKAPFYEAVKGAPAAVLEKASAVRLRDGSTREITEEDRRMWRAKNEELAGNGLRVLALAEREVDDFNIEPYHELVFLGLVGLSDPPRSDIKRAVETCRNAGIRVVMITGDQQPTAAAVGKEVGIADAGSPLFHGERLKAVDALTEEEKQELLEGAIFYRVSPEQKLNLISLHQDAGSIVAMTGDGVNDAPALKKADIGVAMGKRGEPVAEDASDMILQNDRFATIPVAIEGGRIIFDNIRKFVLYMISGNVGEILIVMLATLVGAPLPLLPLQILYINAVNDIFPALALGVGKGSATVMKRPPRDPSEPILTRRNWIVIGLYGLLIGVSVLAGFTLALTRFGWSVERAVTCTFLSIAFARLWHVFNMREHASGFFRNEVTRNPFVWGALLLCIVLLLAAVYISPIATVLKVVDPGVEGWALILAVSLVPVVVGQIVKTFLRKKDRGISS